MGFVFSYFAIFDALNVDEKTDIILLKKIFPKYRLLTRDELTELEPEFVHFLVVNGIASDDWVELKKSNPQKTNDFISLFSDVILEGSMRKIQFVEWRSKNDLKIFKCGEKIIELVGISVEANSEVDFIKENYFASTLDDMPAGVSIYSGKKEYALEREKEIFNMIQSGCTIVDGSLFNAISYLDKNQ